MIVIAWVVLGVVLLAFEMHHGAFYALFGAAGAFAAGIVAVFFPEIIAAQVAALLLVTTLGIIAVRPKMSEAMHHRRAGGKLGRGVHGTLVGEEVLTLDVVGDAQAPGHVRLAGERWLAASGSGGRIPAGSKVLVTAVEGTTLVVWPIDGSTPVPEELTARIEQTNEQAPDGAEGEEP